MRLGGDFAEPNAHNTYDDEKSWARSRPPTMPAIGHPSTLATLGSPTPCRLAASAMVRERTDVVLAEGLPGCFCLPPDQQNCDSD